MASPTEGDERQTTYDDECKEHDIETANLEFLGLDAARDYGVMGQTGVGGERVESPRPSSRNIAGRRSSRSVRASIDGECW